MRRRCRGYGGDIEENEEDNEEEMRRRRGDDGTQGETKESNARRREATGNNALERNLASSHCGRQRETTGWNGFGVFELPSLYLHRENP